MTAKLAKLVHRSLIGLSIVSLILTIVLVIRYWTIHEQMHRDSREAVLQAADAVSLKIQDDVLNLQVADEIVSRIQSEQLDAGQIEQLLQQTLESHPLLHSLSVAYVAGTSRTRDQAPIEIRFERGDAEIQRMEVPLPERSQDEESGNWYWLPVTEGHSHWSRRPQYCEQTQRWRSAVYSTPLLDSASADDPPEVVGVVTACLSTDWVRNSVYRAVETELGILHGDAVYGAIVNSRGEFLTHPDRTVVTERMSLNDFGGEFEPGDQITQLPSNPDFTHIHVLERFTDQRSQQRQTLYFSPISSTGWWVMIALNQHRLLNRPIIAQFHRRNKIAILIVGFTCLISLIAVLVRVERGTLLSLWTVSSSFALLSLIGIICLWWMNVTSHNDRGADQTVLTNRAIVAKRLIEITPEEDREPISVPTGIKVQSIEFLGAYNVKVSGYVWQKYAHDLPDWVKPVNEERPGFVLPEAEDIDIQPAFHQVQQDQEVYCWSFQGILRQKFHFDRYPFDQLDVWFRIWHYRFDQRVVVVPDLQSYFTLDPSALPGIEQNDFVLEGWNLKESFFSYRLNRYTTDLGMQSLREADQEGIPELYFNVMLQRNALTPFVANVIPLGVVALLLFSVVLTIRTESSVAERLGFNTNTVLGFSAALFFVVIIGHVNLRDHLASEGIIYLEWMYFVSYLTILGVSVNALIIGSVRENSLLLYRDNLLIRLLFWPSYIGCLFLVSLLTFS